MNPSGLPGIAIGVVFMMARRAAAREASLAEHRTRTMLEESQRRADLEGRARAESLGRMRAITNAQLTSQISGSRIPAGIMVPRGAGAPGASVSPFIPQLTASAIG